jgi:hypothetical protein
MDNSIAVKLCAVWVLSLTAICIFPSTSLAAETELSQRLCLPGLDQLAAAEKARDASRHESEISALQNAIELYDDCVATAEAKGWDTTAMQEHLIDAHLSLSDALYAAGRFADAKQQAEHAAFGLMVYCGKLREPLSADKHISPWTDAHYYVETLVPRFSLSGTSVLKSACGI